MGTVAVEDSGSLPKPVDDRDDKVAMPGVVREIILIAIGYGAYTMVRKSSGGGEKQGLSNAARLARWESSAHIDMERAINHFFSAHRLVASLSGWYYATMHFVVTIGVLVWVHRRHPREYRFLRTGLMACNYCALLIFLTWPLAPPRLAEKGFDDIVISANIWGSFANKNLASTADQYAAMPSLHTAWSLWSGLAVAWLARRWWVKVLGIAYPVLTIVVIMGTGNHYILDAVGGAAVLAVGLALSPLLIKGLDRWHVTWLTAYTQVKVRVRRPRTVAPRDDAEVAGLPGR